jgi:hypothetical protein
MSISRIYCSHVSSQMWYVELINIGFPKLILEQEKLNEAIMLLNKSLQVRKLIEAFLI